MSDLLRMATGEFLEQAGRIKQGRKNKEYYRRRREQWKLDGLCSMCGGRRDHARLLSCSKCRARTLKHYEPC